MLSSSHRKIHDHASPACPHVPQTGDSARKLRNTRDPGSWAGQPRTKNVPLVVE